jgi:hypothetical protein
MLPLASPTPQHHAGAGHGGFNRSHRWDSSRIPVIFKRLLRFHQMVGQTNLIACGDDNELLLESRTLN